MKLAFLAARNSIHTVRWANALVAKGNEVHLISSHRGGDALDDRIRVHFLPIPAPAGYFLNVSWLNHLLRKIKPDILHAHYASGYGTLGRLSGFHPYILSVWGSDVFDFPYKSFINRKIVVANLYAADHICSTSKVMAEQVRKLTSAIRSINVIPFGIDTKIFRPALKQKNEDTITIGTVKTLASKYGIDILIRAFAEVRRKLKNNSPEMVEKLRLLIVGDGPDLKLLQDLTRKEGVADITEFAGKIPHHLVPDYLNRLDIYVAVSRFESFGVAVLEASACGLPVVVSDVGGLPEVVLDGVTGYVVEKENIEATADALLKLVKDPALRDNMGKAGRRYVLEQYNWEENVKFMEKVYKEVLERGILSKLSAPSPLI
jgi:glycosyltransferase involved in cell wall biosynthesis